MFTEENIMKIAAHICLNVQGTWSLPNDVLLGLWIDGKGWNPFTNIQDAINLATDTGLVVDFYNMRVIKAEDLYTGRNNWMYPFLEEDEEITSHISRYVLNTITE